MIRESNGSAEPVWWAPDGAPSGSDNFANLLRDPAIVASAAVARGLAQRGFADLRPALTAVAQHVAPGGTRITELAERAQLTKPTVVVAVDELVRLGYAQRIPDPGDGRAKLVIATERGHAAERVAREIIAELRDAWAQQLEAGELDQLEALLRRLRGVLWP
jgi:DNA-binding MarR family transcriptional regulator